MKTVIHVNQHVIKANHKNPDQPNGPPLTVKTYKDNRLGHEAVIRSKDGTIVGRFIYRPDKPLSCGAKVWFECETENVEVEVLNEFTTTETSDADKIDQGCGEDRRRAKQAFEDAGLRIRPPRT